MSRPFYPNIETNALHLRLGVVFGGAISAGSAAYTTTHSVFTAADVGQPITIIGAGALVGTRGALFVTTVATFHSATSVDLADTAITTVAEDSENTTLFRDRGTLMGSINWRDSLTVNNTMTFTIRDKQPFPTRGQPVLLSLDGTGDLFGGFLTRVIRLNLPKQPGGDTGWKEAQCTAVSWDKLVYRRVTGQPTSTSGSPAFSNPDAGVFTNNTLGEIAIYLTINALGAEGLDVETVSGPTIPSFEVNYASCGEAFDQLIQAANSISAPGDTYFWYVDPFKVIRFAKNSTVPAPWNISDADGSDADILVQVQVQEDDQQYANIVFIRQSNQITDPITTDFHGDGTSRTFDLDNPSANDAPTITVNGVSKTVGILGASVNKDWYYQPGSVAITQNETGTVLTSGDTLEVIGPQLVSGVVRYDNSTAIDIESAIEGGTGFWETVIDTNSPSTAADATTLAQAYALQYGVIPKQLEYWTYRPGIRVGQLQTVTLSDILVDGDYLVSNVEMSTVENRMLFHVTAVGSPLTFHDWRATLATLRPGSGNGGSGASGGVGPQLYWRALLVFDTATGTDIAPRLTVQGTGQGRRVAAVLRKAITSNLIVQVVKNGGIIATMTVPSSTAIGTKIQIPITNIKFIDGEVLSFNITASDGKKDKNGVVMFSVEWGQAVQVTVMGQWKGPWSSGNTYVTGDTVGYLGSSWISLIDGNLNNPPNTSPADWDLVAAKGEGVATGGITGQVLAKASNTDFDTHWVTAGAATVLTTKGDLLTISGSPAVATRLPVGTDDYVLTADSSTTEGIAWKTSKINVDAEGTFVGRRPTLNFIQAGSIVIVVTDDTVNNRINIQIGGGGTGGLGSGIWVFADTFLW